MSRRSRHGLLIVALVALLGVSIQGAAQAATKLPYSAGTYTGKIYQLVPRRSTGKISFVVAPGTISVLRTVFYASCSGVGLVHDSDPVPAVAVPVGPTGGFSYSGTIDGRRLRFSGILHGRTVVGGFFETFMLGAHSCSTERGASFTGTR
jgi:hypothetical protein